MIPDAIPELVDTNNSDSSEYKLLEDRKHINKQRVANIFFIIHLTKSIIRMQIIRDVAQPGSALHWGCSGRRFKSGHPDHLFLSLIAMQIAKLEA